MNLNGEETRDVALGNLTGLRMAVQAAGAEDLIVGDEFTLDAPTFNRPASVIPALISESKSTDAN